MLLLLLGEVREVRLCGTRDANSAHSLCLVSGLACPVNFGNALLNKVNTAFQNYMYNSRASVLISEESASKHPDNCS